MASKIYIYIRQLFAIKIINLNTNFHDTVAPLIYNPDKRPLHDYLRAEGLLANNVDCQHCQQPMKLVDRPNDQEKFSWRCSNGRCARTHSRMSVKTGSFFEKTKVPLAKWLQYMSSSYGPSRHRSPTPVVKYCKVYQLFAQGREFYWWIQDTRVSSIVCFTILVLLVLLDEEDWSFQYCVFYNTSITSIAGWRILELPVVCALQY